MICALCHRRMDVGWRMNEKGEEGVFACSACAVLPNFWERFVNQRTHRNERLGRNRDRAVAS